MAHGCPCNNSVVTHSHDCLQQIHVFHDKWAWKLVQLARLIPEFNLTNGLLYMLWCYIHYARVCYARDCSKYEDFLFRGSLLVSKLLKQGYSSRKLQTTFRNYYCHHTDIVHNFDTFRSVTYVEGVVRQLWLRTGFLFFSPRIVTGATCGAGNAHSFRNKWFHPLIIYTLHTLSVQGLCLRIHWKSLTAFINTYILFIW